MLNQNFPYIKQIEVYIINLPYQTKMITLQFILLIHIMNKYLSVCIVSILIRINIRKFKLVSISCNMKVNFELYVT